MDVRIRFCLAEAAALAEADLAAALAAYQAASEAALAAAEADLAA
jgi:hypothetical protein